MSDLADARQTSDEPERPQHGNRTRDAQDGVESTAAAIGLDDPHFSHDLRLSEPGRKPFATFGVSSVRECQTMQSVEPMKAACCASAHRTAAVEKY
jgi:hypothetical protein